jgi:hypothetical protein
VADDILVNGPAVGTPEPSTIVSAGIAGLVALGWRRRRKVA